MAQDENKGTALDWDDEVEDTGGFIVLDAGYYPFTVSSLERERFEGSAKMAPCPRAHLTLKVDGPMGTAFVHERLLLNTKTAWRVAKFFEALGFQKNPETGKVPMAWSQIEGRTGWLKLKVRTYESNGEQRETNDVDEFVPPSGHEAAYNEFCKQCGQPQDMTTAQPQQAYEAPAYQQPAPQPQPYQQQMPMQVQQPAPQYQQPHQGWNM